MTALALVRFAHFMGAMLTFGISVYLWAYAPERLRLDLSPAARRLAVIASFVALITAILWLQLEAASMAGDLSAALDASVIDAVLTDTAFGHAWAAHCVLGAALAAAVLLRPRDRWGPAALAAGALLASFGLVGHAAMQSGAEGVLHRLNHAAHLLAGGAWLGGLIVFAMSLRAFERDDLRREAMQAMMSFSFWGQLIVAAVVLTGMADIAMTSGRPPIPPTTLYRALLLTKIVLVAVMISLALVNRFVLAPRIKANVRALAMLRSTCAAEIALGSAVVALVSVFALLDPA